MTRDQAKAILANLDLIKHFAQGGDIGHRGYTWNGEPLDIKPASKITLGNLKPCRDRYYVKVKAKFAWNPVLKIHERQQRCWPERIDEHEVIPPEEVAS